MNITRTQIANGIWLFCTMSLFAIGTPVAHAEDPKPNIILINLDDADSDLLSPAHIQQRFPNMEQLVTNGLYFSNLHVTTPLCGPSRACLFRGQYAHKTGIRVNNPISRNSSGFDGGMILYESQGFMEDDISVWMKDAGYHTMLVGRYINGDLVAKIPDGWDDYYLSLGGSYYETARYTNRDREFGGFERLAPGEYRTTAESNDVVRLINEHAASASDKPFFMYFAPLTPHSPAMNAIGGAATDRYSRWWTRASIPNSPSIDEEDFSDKTSVINWMQPLRTGRTNFATSLFRDRLRTVRSFDDSFKQIMQAVEDNELSDNTYVLVTSDNGFGLGHHRLLGKGTSFERSTRVPLYVLGPNIPTGVTANHLLAHIDITATVLELGGAADPGLLDGKSFLPLLMEPGEHAEHQWRDPILIENWESRTLQGERVQMASSALRYYDRIYTEWADGTTEFYDLTEDPDQLDNVFDQLPVLEQQAHYFLLRQAKSTIIPQTSLAEPFTKNEVVTDDYVITGLAEDDKGVGSVQLTIIDNETQKHWNGTVWQDERIRVPATITNLGHQVTTWTYDSLPKSRSTERSLTLWARAYDQEGNFDTSPVRTWMRIEANRPKGVITTPTEGEVASGNVHVTGDLGDSDDIEEVWLVIIRLDDRAYWTGAAWSTNWSFVRPTLLPDGWAYDVDLEDGEYFLSSRLRTKSGVVQNPHASRRFVVVNE